MRYPLAVAEKDYFLAIVLKILFASVLKDVLVFKGGTALHHTYLPQLRFSQDLDFTALRRVSIEELVSIFEAYEFLELKKHYSSPATIKIERLLYNGPLAMPASLKIEIDFKQNVVFPAKHITYRNAYNVAVTAGVMDMREICAEKIRAMNERFRYRDFYDFGMMMRELELDLNEVVGLLEHKELRKPLLRENIMEHWRLASDAKERDLSQIHVGQEIDDIEDFLQMIPIV
jgi:predicted nucleotidyltransferase component of viral defense system